MFDASLFKSARAQDQDTQTKTFAVKKGGTLEIYLNPGSVEITPWDKDEVNAEAEIEN